jgi:hypothetical protein
VLEAPGGVPGALYCNRALLFSDCANPARPEEVLSRRWIDLMDAAVRGHPVASRVVPSGRALGPSWITNRPGSVMVTHYPRPRLPVAAAAVRLRLATSCSTDFPDS